jgi:hypothetical protein
MSTAEEADEDEDARFAHIFGKLRFKRLITSDMALLFVLAFACLLENFVGLTTTSALDFATVVFGVVELFWFDFKADEETDEEDMDEADDIGLNDDKYSSLPSVA